jgi:hypothetical protein
MSTTISLISVQAMRVVKFGVRIAANPAAALRHLRRATEQLSEADR